VVSLGGNISSDNSFCNSKPTGLGDQVDVGSTGLAADLADNCGPTLTLSIPENSVAVGAFEPGGAQPLVCG